jgi:hypothetical protein
MHDALENALRESESLSDRLADEIKCLNVEFSRYSGDERVNIVGARIEDVYSINVISLNVLELFTCEPEIEAEISLDIEVEIEGRYGCSPHDYEYRRHSVSQTRVELVLS